MTLDLTEDTGSRSYELGLALRNADPTTTYDVAVDRVIVTVGGPLSGLDAIDASSLAASLNVAGLDPGTHRRARHGQPAIEPRPSSPCHPRRCR